MSETRRPIRVLYSFPHKLGADRICHTAWEQVNALANAGAQVTVFPGAVHRPVSSPDVRVVPTLARGRWRIPYRLLGRMAACGLHDYIVSRRIERTADQFDIIHTWPLGALRTLKTAHRLGIATALERPNSHTLFGYTTVQREAERIGVILPAGDEHELNLKILYKEELEYQAADGLLCASDFVVKTFLDLEMPPNKLVRHIYGFDEKVFSPLKTPRPDQPGLRVIFAGVGTVVKGLHFGLEAWLKSTAHREGQLVIAGNFMAAYKQRLAPWLDHPSIKLVGQRNDLPELMRQSDLLLLPSLTEGFGLVVVEAMGSGCVPLVSDACTDVCKHLTNSLVHHVGDVSGLSEQLSLLASDPALLAKLRRGALKTAPTVTWTASGPVLIRAYEEILKRRANCVAENATPVPRPVSTAKL